MKQQTLKRVLQGATVLVTAIVCSPFTHAAAQLPGTIQAEDYDGASDTTFYNEGGKYRWGKVDIGDVNSGGYHVGWVAAGEYIHYNVNIQTAGTYAFTTRIATTKENRKFHFKLDGTQLGSTNVLPNTGGWQAWQDVTSELYLPSGNHILEIFFETRDINLDYVSIAPILDNPEPEPPTGDWTLVWSDEFSGSSIDSTKWNYSVNGWGGGNNELQYYTDRSQNAYIDNGILNLVARKERYSGSDGTRDYTSARLDTKRKADFLYGKVSVRAQLPQGQGLWPAIWMLPTDDVYGGWASSGEIDIMEAVNLHENGNSKVYGTLHYGGAWPNNTHTGQGTAVSPNPADSFHEYSVEWEPNEIRWYIDGQHYQTQTDWYTEGGIYPAPFDQKFHLILNVAVGGNWPGNPNSNTTFPQAMKVDYVRVFTKDDNPISQQTLSIVNHSNGLVTSNEHFYCGSECEHTFTESKLVRLTAQPDQGFEFSRWEDNSICQNDLNTTPTRCDVAVNPNNADIELHAYFVASDSCENTSAYQGSPTTLPGRIEAEQYDEGCAGYAYFDTDEENTGGKFRNDEVDIESTSDVGGGYNVGWLRDGEWLDYTVKVSTAGKYDINLRIASKGNGSTVRLSQNGSYITDTLSFSRTGDWQTWKTVTVRGVNLAEGIQTIRLNIVDGDFNLNYIDVTEANKGPFTVDKSRGEWSLIVIPDTQHYSQNRDNAPIENMRTAFQWIVDTKDDLNLKFVQGLGDITESWDARWEWDNSTSAWDKLYGEVPFMPIIGNHDSPWMLNQYFPASSFSNESWWGGDFGGVENNYALMTIGNEDYLFLQVETYDQYSDYRPEGLAWAKKILSQYPDRKVILATHDTWATSHIKNNLLTQFDNIVLSNAGHVCQREAYYTTSGPRGGIANNFITDYQCDAQEVMNIRYYVFKPMEDRVDYFTYSPVTKKFEVDDSSQGSFSLYQVDP